MNSANFELDLLDFQGEPIELSFEAPIEELEWLKKGLESTGFRPADDVPFKVDLSAQLIETTVRLHGEVEGALSYECGRCMRERRFELDSSVEFVLMSRASWEEAYGDREEIVLSADDLDVSFYEGEVIDLRPLIVEAVVLELPTFARCPEEDKASCDAAFEAHVGEETVEANEANSIDLRWSKLREIKLKNDDNE
ncbi:hypothetical protein FRC96_09115 [Lujinxingia vulgaris]|uniref:DUF177 domain-containing protein n=1 Tax=Lujinxingia vulgaris TaxID=2600176 RepID=A0A5C6X4T1_9DELT|nr:YceD family protein [Lujinxingia vulgaris]TXD36868.1 hypothetical protein FRC96_09115 [Lujinxingia vulgaris]